jgi:hypothetical protein
MMLLHKEYHKQEGLRLQQVVLDNQ